MASVAAKPNTSDTVQQPTLTTRNRTTPIRSNRRAQRPMLPNSGERFPDRLADMQLGVSVPWYAPLGLWNVTFGSASDRLFASPDEMTPDITWAVGMPQAPDDAFFFINWQNNRDYRNRLLVPGFVYRHKQGNWFTLMTGFPVNAFSWRPVEKVELSASYEFPRTVYSELAYRPVKSVKLHAGFDWTNQRYFRYDRVNVRDRLWRVEKRLLAGVRWQPNETFFVDFGGGYSFDRFWFEGEDYEDRSYNRINVSDGPFVQLRVGLRF